MSQDKDRNSKVRAQAALESIAQLRGSEAFMSYLLPKLLKRLEESRKAVLHDTKLDTPQKLWEARLLYLERFEASRLLEMDETAARSIIGSTQASDLPEAPPTERPS